MFHFQGCEVPVIIEEMPSYYGKNIVLAIELINQIVHKSTVENQHENSLDSMVFGYNEINYFLMIAERRFINIFIPQIKNNSSRLQSILRTIKFVWRFKKSRRILLQNCINLQVFYMMTDYPYDVNSIKLSNKFMLERIEAFLQAACREKLLKDGYIRS